MLSPWQCWCSRSAAAAERRLWEHVRGLDLCLQKQQEQQGHHPPGLEAHGSQSSLQVPRYHYLHRSMDTGARQQPCPWWGSGVGESPWLAERLGSLGWQVV